MKKYLITIALFLGLSFSGLAQDDLKNDGGRLEALKIAFITRKLNLSTEEAQKFWPIYNQYSREMRDVLMQARQNKDDEIKREEKVLEIRKKFNSEFTRALSAEKVNTFFRAEREFVSAVQKEMMERRQQRIDNRRQRLNNQ